MCSIFRTTVEDILRSVQYLVSDPQDEDKTARLSLSKVVDTTVWSKRELGSSTVSNLNKIQTQAVHPFSIQLFDQNENLEVLEYQI